jgi:lysophospholipase L1-like esterase
MTALAAGASVTVAVRDGGTITISTNGGFGSASVTTTEGASSTVSFGPEPVRRVLGPYKEGGSATITNATSGAFDYDVETMFDPGNVAITGGVSQGVFSVGPAVAINSLTRMSYRKMMAKVLSGSRARLLIYGDSTTMGAGAGTNSGGTTGVVGARAGCWVTKLAAALTAAGIPTYNEAVMGDQNATFAGETYATYDPRTTIVGWTTSSIDCPGGRGWTSSTIGHKWSLTPGMTFDRFDVYYTTSVGNGSMTADVDGGATLATINTSAATGIAKTTVSCTRGTHTLNLTVSTANNIFLIGVVPWDSTVGGLDIIQCGWWGGKASNLSVNTNAWSVANPAILTSIAPDLGIIQLTINDATQSTAAATFAANLAVIDTAMATAGAEVAYMSGIPSSDVTSTNGQLAAIVAAVSSRAAAQSRLYMDLGARCVDYATMSGAGWMYDTKHGNTKLYADEGYWGSRVLNSLGQ